MKASKVTQRLSGSSMIGLIATLAAANMTPAFAQDGAIAAVEDNNAGTDIVEQACYYAVCFDEGKDDVAVAADVDVIGTAPFSNDIRGLCIAKRGEAERSHGQQAWYRTDETAN